MATAPLLTAGQSVTASILPDEVQTYRIPAGWGQAVRVTLEQPTQLEAAPGDLPGHLRLRLIHPSGHSKVGSRAVAAYAGGEVSDESTPMWPGGDEGADPAGDVTVVIYWHGGTDREREPVDYVLTAQVAGELLEAPEYVLEPVTDAPEPEPTGSEDRSGIPKPSPEITPPSQTPASDAPTVEETQETSETPADETDGGPSGTVIALALLGGLLAIGGGVTALMLSRRRR